MVDIIGMIEQKNGGVLRRKVMEFIRRCQERRSYSTMQDITGIIEFEFYSRSSYYPSLF